MAKVDVDQSSEFFGRFFRLGGTMRLFLKLLGDDKFMAEVMEFAEQKMNLVETPAPVVNPFKQSVDEQIVALRKQNVAGKWGISEEKLLELASSAPAWPEGKDAYRSFRIRFGEGQSGVIQTFEAHIAAMKRVHGAKFWRWDLLLSGKSPYRGEDIERLRLFNGDHTHHAVVEWVTILDLGANRTRESITAVRHARSLADEGIVLAWLVPKRVKAIDYKEWCAFFLAGYENNVPEGVGEGWGHVACVDRDLGTVTASMYASWRSDARSEYSVPSFG